MVDLEVSREPPCRTTGEDDVRGLVEMALGDEGVENGVKVWPAAVVQPLVQALHTTGKGRTITVADPDICVLAEAAEAQSDVQQQHKHQRHQQYTTQQVRVSAVLAYGWPAVGRGGRFQLEKSGFSVLFLERIPSHLP